MKLYIIDTARPTFWNDLSRNDLCFVCDADNDTKWEFDRNDVVFAHSHEYYQNENPDLILRVCADNSPVIQNFCKALVVASDTGVTPMIVFYSGGDCNLTWKALAASKCAPLHGFPSERIECYLETIHRQNCTEEIREMVETVLPQLEAIAGGAPINLDLSWLEEVKLAARLLVEAAESKAEDFPSIHITKPTEPLLSVARQVIEAADRQENIIPSANALCEALGCSRPTQP